MMLSEGMMDSFPSLPKVSDQTPTPTPPPVQPAAAAMARARLAAKSVKMMYVWIGVAVVAFIGIAWYGLTGPSASDANTPGNIVVPGTQTPEMRAQEKALTDWVKRMKDQQESGVIVLQGSRTQTVPGGQATPPATPRDMFIKFTPGAQPTTRPTTINGRTKPFLAPDVAQDGSFFGQIDKATGKPKTVYSSHLNKYTVDPADLGDAPITPRSGPTAQGGAGKTPAK